MPVNKAINKKASRKVDKQQIQQQLSQLLKTLSLHFQTLLQTMHEEKQTLLQAPDCIEQVLHNKMAIVEKIERLGAEQEQLLQQAGFSQDEAGLQACIQWCASNDKLKQSYETLKHLIAECKESNLVIGSLLEMTRLKTAQLLNLLTQGNNGRSTYNAEGQSKQDQNDGNLSIKA